MLGERKWLVAGTAAVVIGATSALFFKLWRAKLTIATVAMARLRRKSAHGPPAEPPAAEERSSFRFSKSTTYLDCVADIRRQLSPQKALSKAALIALRVALRELVKKDFTETYARNLQRRQPFLENISEWSELYVKGCAELAALVAEGERAVADDCGIAHEKYLDFHCALQQKDHHYLVTTIKTIDKLKSLCRKRADGPVPADLLRKIVDYKTALAKNVPLEAFPAEGYLKTEHKWHIINELAYYTFRYYEGDVPTHLYDDPEISAKHKILVEEFLFQTFPGICLPN